MKQPSVGIFCDQPSARYEAFCRMASRHFSVACFFWDIPRQRWITRAADQVLEFAILHFFSLSSREGWPSFLKLPAKGIRVVDLYDTAIGQRQKTDHLRSDLALLSAPEALSVRDPRIHRALRTGWIPEPKGGYEFLPDPVESGRRAIRREGKKPRAALVGWVDDLENPQGHTRRLIRNLMEKGMAVTWIPSVFQREALKKTYEGSSASMVPDIVIPPNKEEYWRVLQSCDFGICPGVHRSADGRLLNTDLYLSGCGSSRLADYCAAGIGALIQRSLRYLCYYASRNAPWWVVYRDPSDPCLEGLPAKARQSPKNSALPLFEEEKISTRLREFYLNLLRRNPSRPARPPRFRNLICKILNHQETRI